MKTVATLLAVCLLALAAYSSAPPERQPFTYSDGITLRDYIDTRLAAMQSAVDLARGQMDKRLDGMNEFRDALKDQAAMLATKTELESAKAMFEADIRSLRESRAELSGKASMSSVYGAYALAGAGIVVSLLRNGRNHRKP